MYKIKVTSDYESLIPFFEENGLELENSENFPIEILKNWRCDDAGSGELLAAASLQKISGHFVLEDLAVREDMRGTGLGKELLRMVEQEAKSMGAEDFWLVAKVPQYYKKFQWQEVPREEAPDISKCFHCENYKKTCFPSIMRKSL